MGDTGTSLRRSPLDASHRALGAKMGAFGGWDMPIEYDGTLAEHARVRTTVGLFDVSHLGKLMVSGPGAVALLDRALTNRFSDLAPGRARYSLILDERGGIVDDLIVYVLGPERYLAVPNASNRDEVADRLRALGVSGASVETLDWYTIAVQGPRSREMVGRFGDAEGLAYMRCTEHGGGAIARSGYTGEVGWELFGPSADAPALWDELLSAARGRGGGPAGLGARDTLRTEMGYPLHGNDIDRTVVPAEAGLEWAVALDKGDFTGRAAVLERAPRTALAGLRMEDRRIPRHGHPVLAGGERIGTVTSGTFSPTLRVGIALAAVVPKSVAEGDLVEVDVRGKAAPAHIVRPPFVDRSPKG